LKSLSFWVSCAFLFVEDEAKMAAQGTGVVNIGRRLHPVGGQNCTPVNRLDFFSEIAVSGGGVVGGRNRTGFGLGGIPSAIAGGENSTEAVLTLGLAERIKPRLRLEQAFSISSDGTRRIVLEWEYNFGLTESK
jgi:hypothetical protein